MKATAHPRQTARRLGRQPQGYTEALAGVVLAVALTGLTTVVSGRVSGTAGFFVPIGVLVCAVLVLNRRTELGLAAVLLYVGLLDGYLKLSTGSSQVTVVRDVLLYSVVVGVAIRAVARGERIRLPPYTLHILLFIAFVLAQSLNPGTPGAKAAFGGLRQHLEFVPLFILGYLVLRTRRRVRWLFGLLIIVVLANAAVAAIQYNLTPEQLAGWGPGYAERVLGTGDFIGGGRTFADGTGAARVRPFGLGSDLGAAGILGALGLAGSLALISAGASKLLRIVGASGVLGCIAAVATAQSRLAIIYAVFTVVVFIAISATSRTATRVALTLAVSAVLAFFAVSVFVGAGESGSFSRYETLAPGQLRSTIEKDRGGSAAVIPQMAVNYPLGVGLGRAGPAAGFGGGSSGLNSENEFTFLIGEIGTLGMVILLALWLRVIAGGIAVVRRQGDAEARVLLAGLVTPVAATMLVWFAATPTNNAPVSPLFWLFAGALSWASTAGANVFPRQGRVGDRPVRTGDRPVRTGHGFQRSSSEGPADGSVVIATRNRPESLQRCLAALDEQDGRARLEIIVVDDCSSPPLDPGSLATRWPLRVLKGPGSGPARARNVGIAAARAEVVLFTDDDTLPHPSWASTAVQTLVERSDCVGVEGPVQTPPYDPLFEYSITADGGGFYWTCNVAYRRETLRTLGGFDSDAFPRFREDRDLAFRALALGPISYSSAMVVTHTPRPITLRWVYDSNRAARADPVLARRHPEHFQWGNSVPLRLQPVVGAVKNARAAVASEGRSSRTTLRRRLRAMTMGVVSIAGAVVGVSSARAVAGAPTSEAAAGPRHR